MDDSRSTYSVLVVSAAAKFHTSLRELLPEDRYAPLCAASSVAEARRVLLERPFDIVIISAPLPDEFGTKLALHIIDKSSAGVLLLVKADLAETVAMRVEEYGVLVLGKPVAKPLFDQAMRFSLAMRNRMLALREENARLEKKLADTKLIDRAKCMLIQYLGMTEEQAHRQIEKQAMDNRQTKTAVAQGILASYEL